MTAILNMPADLGKIRKTLTHLRAQTVREQLEVVIVTMPELEATVDTALLEPFGVWQVVTIPRMTSTAAGYAAGSLRARSPIVVFCEDHSFPEPEWAERLIEAHDQDCAAVAPAIRNGNPRTLVSWANFLLCFIEWFSPERSGRIRFGPGHNTSYKRDLLLGYKDLENFCKSERVLHLDMEAKGLPMMFSAGAVTHHVNISLARSYLAHSFEGGRIFGALRAESWSRSRAWLYAFLFMLVPIVRLRRMLKLLDTPAKRQASRFWTALPWISAGLLLHAMGEAAGYVTGAGGAFERYMSFEAYRYEHVNARDRAALAPLEQVSGGGGGLS